MAAAEVASYMPEMNLNLDHVDLDAIKLPPNEDFGIKSDDEEEEELSQDEIGFDNIVVVSNLPVVEPVKYEKLEGVIRKIFGQMGTIVTLCMPRDEATSKTMGFAFIEMSNKEEAVSVRDKVDGYKLDKSHIFNVRMFGDFDKYANVPAEWSPPKIEDYKPGQNLHAWLMDEWGRDQFVIRYGTETEVMWNDGRVSKPVPVYQRNYWTESFVQWSPLGTYIGTIHRQGAAIWGWGGVTGENTSEFTRLARFLHHQVRLIDFSPGEKFLVTYSSHEPTNPRETQKVVLKIFDIRSGECKREFQGSADEFATAGTGGVSWPVFKWSGGRDDKYFARIQKNAVSVYETETMSLVDKKSLKVDNVMDFSWSPTDSILALFVPEANGGNQPARVSLVQIPSKEELRQKNLFSVSECKMYWQSNGEYLAVKVDRYTKTKKSTYSGFELFRIKERDIPIEVLELENKNDKILAFAWEPKGHRFAVLHGDGPKPDVSFYSMRSPNNTGRVTKLTTIKGKQANALYWSPAGRFIVFAGQKTYNGQLEFFNVDDLETMATAEHFMATDVEWDPSGRYVATCVTSVQQMENGFNMWTFHGKLMYKISRERFNQFLWRPRPPSLLTAENEAEVFKNLKKYSKGFEQEDIVISQQHSAHETAQRRRLVEEWKSWLARWKKERDAEKAVREELRDGVPSDDEQEYADEEVEIEEIMNVEEITEEDE